MNRGVFNEKVDPVRFQCLDYFNIIKSPMDLGTVKQNLQAMLYKNDEEFSRDVRLTFQNAMRYNPADHYVHQSAKQLMAEFEADFAKVSARPSMHAMSPTPGLMVVLSFPTDATSQGAENGAREESLMLSLPRAYLPLVRGEVPQVRPSSAHVCGQLRAEHSSWRLLLQVRATCGDCLRTLD